MCKLEATSQALVTAMTEPRDEDTIDPEWADLFRTENSPVRSVLETLRDVPIFSTLDQDDLARLARLVHVRRYAPKECVIEAGASQSGFYVIRSGEVQIVRRRDDGRDETVDLLGPGDLLGEFGLLDDAPRSSSLIATESCELIGFFRPDLMDILDTRPSMGCRILLRLGQEMAKALHRDYAALRATGFSGAEASAVTAADRSGAP
jgi:CRP-like cAMP-binding protein